MIVYVDDRLMKADRSHVAFERTVKGKQQHIKQKGSKKEEETEQKNKKPKGEQARTEAKGIVDSIGNTMKIFKQSEGMCGPTSVSMALTKFRKNYSPEQIAKIAHSTASEGTDSGELVKAIKSVGIDVVEYKNLSRLHALHVLRNHTKNGEPCIVSWLKTKLVSSSESSIKGSEGMKPGFEEVPDMKTISKKQAEEAEHYSVVKSVDDKYVHMLDPLEDKEQSLPIKYFLDRWWDSEDKRWFLVLTK
jgi:hypothetical protein